MGGGRAVGGAAVVASGDGFRRTTAAKAHTLIEALPWLARLHGSTVVISADGSAMTDETLKLAFAQDVAFLRCAGLAPVVVHGGGPQAKAHLARLGQGPAAPESAETMDLVRMVITGRLQRELVGLLNLHGPFAVGMTGEDAHTITAVERRTTANGEPPGPGRIDEVSQVGQVNGEVVRTLLDDGRIPVVSAIARSENGAVCRVDTDAAAAGLAAALQAKRLVLLTDTKGPPGEMSARLTAGELERLLPQLPEAWQRPMEACLRALRSGVGRARVLDGRVPHVLLQEVFAGEALGTTVYPRQRNRRPEP